MTRFFLEKFIPAPCHVVNEMLSLIKTVVIDVAQGYLDGLRIPESRSRLAWRDHWDCMRTDQMNNGARLILTKGQDSWRSGNDESVRPGFL